MMPSSVCHRQNFGGKKKYRGLGNDLLFFSSFILRRLRLSKWEVLKQAFLIRLVTPVAHVKFLVLIMYSLLG